MLCPSDVGDQEAARHQLAEDAAPAPDVELVPDAEGRQLVVAEAFDLLGLLAAQDVDQVLRAEALAGAVDRGEGLLRRDRRVPGGDSARGRCRSCRSSPGASSPK